MPTHFTWAAASLGALLAFSLPASAAVPFTWDPSKVSPALSGAGGAFTADHVVMSDYVYAHQAATDNVPYDAFFLYDITGFTQQGVAVHPSGLGTSYGLYFSIQEVDTLVNGNAIALSGSVRLMADPTNNDGTPSTTINGIAFSNPAGVADDITLATGQLITSSFVIQNGIASKYQLETFNPSPGEQGFFVNPINHMLIELFNTNTPTSREFFLQSDGSGITVVNGAIGSADILVPEPTSMLLLGGSMVCLGVVRRRRSAVA